MVTQVREEHKRIEEEMGADLIELLEGWIDKYGVSGVLSGISKICSDKAEHVAVNWQDTTSGKYWIWISRVVDQLNAKIEK